MSREELESLLAQAQQRGREEARAEWVEEYEQHRRAEAERTEQAERSLRDAREAIAGLCDGLADALSRHAASIESSAADIACAVTARLVHPLVVDGSVVEAMCRQLIDECQDESARLQVSPDDVDTLPESIRGVRVCAVEGIPRGRCVLIGSRGSMHGDIGERWRAIAVAFRELMEHPAL